MESSKRDWFGKEVRGAKAVMYSMYLVALILGFLIWFNYRLNVSTEDLTLNSFSVQHDLGWIRYLDEGLTMSAYMYVSTGDEHWSRRYDQLVTRLDDILKEAEKNMPKREYDKFLLKTKLANDSLVSMEVRSFNLVSDGRIDEARSLLFGPGYLIQKELYHEGLSGLSSDLAVIIPKRFDQMHQLNLIISLLGLVLIVGIIFVGYRTNSVLKGIKQNLADEYRRYVKKLITQREEMKLSVQQADFDREKLKTAQDMLLKSKEALRKSLQYQSTMNKEILDSQIHIKEIRGEEELTLGSNSIDGAGVGLILFDDNLKILEFGGRLVKEMWPDQENITNSGLIDLIPFLDKDQVSKWESGACLAIDLNGSKYPARFKRLLRRGNNINTLEFFDFTFDFVEKNSSGTGY